MPAEQEGALTPADKGHISPMSSKARTNVPVEDHLDPVGHLGVELGRLMFLVSRRHDDDVLPGQGIAYCGFVRCGTKANRDGPCLGEHTIHPVYGHQARHPRHAIRRLLRGDGQDTIHMEVRKDHLDCPRIRRCFNTMGHVAPVRQCIAIWAFAHVGRTMFSLTPQLQEHLQSLVDSDPVVLFMKGQRAHPQCGFSASVVEILDGLLDDYATHDVLSDMNLREGMKVFSEWPTFPQLYVNGELVGGADIVAQLHAQDELAAMLGSAPATAPHIDITDAARERILALTEGHNVPLRLSIDARFNYSFAHVDDVAEADFSVLANTLTLVFDRASARRANGLRIDFIDDERGQGLVIENPNEPAQVQPLTVDELHQWRTEGKPHHLIDVRTDEEWNIARIEGARLLDAETSGWLETLPRDAVLVMQCHHGVRSLRAAEELLRRGHTRVYNLKGGIDAWSRYIDGDVPTY